MAKLTITFRGIPLNSVDLGADKARIGRDPASEVHIDSLAVADFHAVVALSHEGYTLRSVNSEFVVAVNDKPVVEAVLRSGDEIRVGKHVLFFTDDARPVRPPAHDEKSPRDPYKPFQGSLQVLTGQRIGMVIPLKATVTRIGKEETGLVVVTREEKGYAISPASDNVALTINGKPVARGEAPYLASGDMIRINNALLQYFQE
jgi:sulfur carrier protein ThiS